MIDSLSSEELQFIKAIEKYKADNHKTFLSWTEVLKIVKELGYKKTSRKLHHLPGWKEKEKEKEREAVKDGS